MDSGITYNNSSFRIYRDTGVPGLGVELLKVDNDGILFWIHGTDMFNKCSNFINNQ
jgi:hypothetical protein